MAERSILWVDLRTSPSEPDLCSSLPKTFGAQRLRQLSELLRALRKWCPWAVCFEYDVPDERGLAALEAVKLHDASLPIVMLTEKNGKALSDWAFRRCVWDYLVKPISVRHLCNCLTNIDKAVPPGERMPVQAAADTLVNVFPSVASGGLSSRVMSRGSLAPAVSYVATNYSEKLRLATAAKLCDLSPFQFSRNFKKEHGFTFRDFVVRLRVQRAAELIRQSSVSVTEAAFVVGFNDLSYFARMFRPQLGVCPSHYRSEKGPDQLPLFPDEGTKKR